MTPEQFCYWLQGFAELSPEPPTPEQWKAIREHVATVFKKVTPPVKVAPSIPDYLEEARRKAVEKKPADAWPPMPTAPYVGGKDAPWPKFPDIIC